MRQQGSRFSAWSSACSSTLPVSDSGIGTLRQARGWRSLGAGIALVVSLVLGNAAGVRGAGGEAETDPAKAGPDFALQGEYLGEIGGEKWGGQVIALGEGSFRGIGYKGGLPGDGWKRGDERRVSEGKASDGSVVMKGDDHTATIKGGVITIAGGDGNKIGELRKVERKSPTLGMKPPAGAVVLFDGSTADQFNKVVCSARPTARANSSWATIRCISSSAPRSCPSPAAKHAATAASTSRAATNAKCSTRSAWKAKTTNAAASIAR
jgi:hypothetical protein